MTHPVGSGTSAAAQPGLPSQPGAGGAVPAPAAGPETSEAAPAQQAQAAAAATAEPARQTLQVAALPPAPDGPPPGGGNEDPDPAPERPTWRTRRHRHLHRLRIGQHAAPDRALDRLQLTSDGFGLPLGRSQAGLPVVIPLFGPEPTRVVLIGGPWAAELVTFRALGFGARAVAHTDDPTGWLELGRRATGRTDRIAVLGPGEQLARVASSDAPLLRLTGPGPSAVEPLPDWTTLLAVLPAVAAQHGELIAGADLVLCQRLAPAEATALGAVLSLPDAAVHTVQVLHDDMLAVLARGEVRYAWVRPTSVELELLGAPRRH